MSLRATLSKAASLIAGGVSALASSIVVLLVLVLIVIPDRPAAA